MRIYTWIACLALLPCATATADVSVAPFGKTADGQAVEQYTLTNANGVTAKIITRGATLQSLLVRDRQGRLEDIVLGFDDVAGYESDRNQYFGCTVGRVCNRIGNAQFELNGERFTLEANDGKHTLHGGGAKSLDKVVWEASVPEDQPNAVEFRYFSGDGEEGFPGNVHFSVRYALTDKNSLALSYKATADLETPINMTNHAYFNLSGAGADTILDHVLQIDAQQYTPTDDELIPTGELADVQGSALDFRQPTVIGKRIAEVDKTASIGYDHNWVLDGQGRGVRRVATLSHPSNGRVLTVLTDQPGLQFYSGNFLKGQEGKQGKTYAHRSALCLEAQHYPDAVHHESFPSIVLVPGETYSQTTLYQFSVSQ